MPHSPPPPPADTQNSQQDEAENHFQEIVLELQEAKADELKTLQSRKPSDLLKLVDRGEADEFVSIWEAIASTCQLFDAGPVLIKYLENPLLDRRRRTKAAQTLARMLGLENTHIVFQVAQGGSVKEEALLSLRRLVDHEVARTVLKGQNLCDR
eukprot:GHVT01028417.1.p2 GENE.GHVT01028417.1~~GHVT01028417.1.p2  ORF type:complete len:154 (-),score=14.10 GHVT01028417.1:1573-2034(-)